MADKIPELDLNKVLNGGLMKSSGAVSEEGGIGLTFPMPGIILANHVYIPIVPPLPMLPMVVLP